MIKISKILTGLLVGTMTIQLQALTLDEAVQTALKNSKMLEQSNVAFDIAQRDIKEKRSANYGEFDIVASYTHYNAPRTLAPLTPSSMKPDAASTEDMMSVGVNYTVTLFSGFAQRSQVAISSLQKDMAQQRSKLTKEQIVYNVKTLYANILAQEDVLKAQKSYAKALLQLKESVDLRVKLGSASKVESLKAEVDYMRAKAKCTTVETNIDILKESLATLMFVDSIDKLENIEIDMKKFQAEPTQDYIMSSTQLELASLEIKKAKQMQQIAQSSYYPKVALQAYYGKNAGVNDDTNPNSGDFEDETLWQAGVNLKWNIFDFGKKNAAVQKSKMKMMQSELAKAQKKRELQRDIAKAKSKITEALANYRSLESELVLMQKMEKIDSLRYETGAIDIDTLLYTKARYQLVKSSFAAAKYNYQNAKTYFDYITERGVQK